ncbi:MAG: hypothetical protein Q4C41_00780 [Eggerthellaceae bacterium]|nr:hypothetical protein [Eggerthellaceae bacterium]
MVGAKLLSIAGVSGIAPSLAMWAAVVVLSSAAVALCRRVLPKRLQRLIGFA